MSETSSSVAWVLGQGRYEVKRKLGEGGMAFALLALDKTLGADVVLKVPKPHMMADPEFVRRFKREIRSMQELTHDHIVKIKDVGEHEGMPFYVMDLLAGGSLQDRLEKTADNKIKPMAPDSLTDWLPQVADALDFIHQRFVHRDIKPANILFDAYGHAFVSDFGIVKAIADGSEQAKQTVMTQAGFVVCTPAYMAPELAEGKKIDGRVDQYALAATVYEALSGCVPFGTTYIEVIKQQVFYTIPPLHELAPTLPRSLTQVIEKGLGKEPKDRFATCTDFAKAVLASIKTIPLTDRRRSGEIKAGPKAVCPACRARFSLPTSPEGKRVTCPTCGAGFTVAKRSAKSAVAETKNIPAGPAATTFAPVAKPAAPAAKPVIAKTMIEAAPPAVGNPFAKHGVKIMLAAGGAAILMLLATCLLGLWAGGAFRPNAPQGLVAKDKDGLPKKDEKKQPEPVAKDKDGPPKKDDKKQTQSDKDKLPIAGSSIDNTIGMKLVYVPPGKFLMGSPPGELGREPFDKGNEFQHEVVLTKGLYLGAYAVTQDEYKAVTGKNPSWFSAQGGGKKTVAGLTTGRFPVEQVSWKEATEFCRKLSQKEGKTYRLPTEAEWEYACRAGTTTPFHFGATISTDQANYNGNSVYGNGVKGKYRARPMPVGSFPANAWGLYDMHGNVWQWCEDWYDAKYYENSPKINPVNQTAGQFRVLRGGSWNDDPGNCRSAQRSHNTPDNRDGNNGFRVVLSSP